jgi:hypothetical protein
MDSQVFEELIVLCKSNDREDLAQYLESIEDVIIEDSEYEPTSKEKREYLKDQKLDVIEEGEPETIRVKVDKDGFYSLD